MHAGDKEYAAVSACPGIVCYDAELEAIVRLGLEAIISAAAQDANNISNWKAGSMVGRNLSNKVRQGSDCSEQGECYSQCEVLWKCC